jgi:2-polyprenyl-6-methoxyphenol hydroxylase-like FAD-dependent oxidoreductase
MVDVVIAGGGLAGNCSAMLLAADGHSVPVLERDPAPPPASADEAWTAWTRRGVNQLHMLHYFLPRFRSIAEAELPEVAAELDAAGALRFNPLEAVPVEVSGGLRAGDERHQAMALGGAAGAGEVPGPSHAKLVALLGT